MKNLVLNIPITPERLIQIEIDVDLILISTAFMCFYILSR